MTKRQGLAYHNEVTKVDAACVGGVNLGDHLVNFLVGLGLAQLLKEILELHFVNVAAVVQVDFLLNFKINKMKNK